MKECDSFFEEAVETPGITAKDFCFLLSTNLNTTLQRSASSENCHDIDKN